MSTKMTLKDVMRELAGLEERKMREANERLGLGPWIVRLGAGLRVQF